MSASALTTVAPTAPERRPPLAELAADRLRRLVLDGSLAPGERLGEVALSARLGISRTPLREAFKILAREGLLVLEPNRGARVAPLDRAELEHTVEVMAALEVLVGRLAAVRIDEAELARLRQTHRAMREAYDAADLDRYFAANQAIHLGLVAACRNPVLEEQYRLLNARILRYRYAANLSPSRWAEAMAEHEAILEALEARDGARLGDLLARHLEHKLRPLRERLAASG
jgi:DNA-binding GntR family transcriptional regulator